MMSMEIRRHFSIDAWDLTYFQFVMHWNYCQEFKSEGNPGANMEQSLRSERRQALVEACEKQKIKDGLLDVDPVTKKNKVTPQVTNFLNMLNSNKLKG